MPRITEGNLTFDFPHGWQVAKFDEWSFYRNQFRRLCGGSKGIDILALDPASGWLWQIEVKDYREHRRPKAGGVAEEVVQKARDTLAALAAARVNANDAGEMAMADAALRSRRLRLVLHLEQPPTPSRLSPRDFDPVDIQQRLRQLAKPIDPHPLVHEINRMPNCPWTVR